MLYDRNLLSHNCHCFHYLRFLHNRLRVWLLYGIESLELDARICRAKLPVHRANSLVAMLLPELNLLTKLLNLGDVVRQALPCQPAQFNLGNIEPRSMLEGVMDFQTVDQGFGLLWGNTS